MVTPTKRRRIVGPTIAILLALNLGWLARLEVQAQQANKLLDHHASLESGADELEGLDEFLRRAHKCAISMNRYGLVVAGGSAGSEERSRLSLDNQTARLAFFGANTGDPLPMLELASRSVWLGIQDLGRSLRLDKEGIRLTTNGGKSNEVSVWVDADDGSFWVHSRQGRGYSLGLSPTGGITMQYGAEEVGAMIEFLPESVQQSAGFGAVEGLSPLSLSLWSRADIKLEAGGDLTLKAPSGEIWIDGQRVHLNERGGT